MPAPVLIVIPARMASSRFPGKPLVSIAGRPMIERVWRIARAVKNADRVLIATDHEEIRTLAEHFGAEVVMTSAACRTGTDRVAEALQRTGGTCEIVFNLQGDSVLTPPWIIEDVITELKRSSEVRMATPAVELRGQALKGFLHEKKKGSTTGTTVVFNRTGDALYFSKSVIPFSRTADERYAVYRHIGLYGYRRETLAVLNQLPEGRLERIEQLEQLRALENGIPIRVVLGDYRGRTPAAVDSPEDVAIVEEIIAREGELVDF